MRDQPVADSTQHSQEIFITSEVFEPATQASEREQKKGIIYIKIYPASKKGFKSQNIRNQNLLLETFQKFFKAKIGA
jgi:hypothetical protein